MSTAVAGVLLALAVLLVPVARSTPRSRAGSGAVASPGAQGRRPPAGRDRLLLVAAVSAVGCACLAVFGVAAGLLAAAVACPVAGVGLRRVQRRAEPVRADAALALALDLAAAALRAGRPLSEALSRAAPVASPGTADLLNRVAGLLRLGADPAAAWAAIPPDGPLSVVAAAATRSAASGVRVATAFERAAAQVRTDLAGAAAVRAQRAGVFAMAPLGLCFLPSFVCLGVVPVVVGVAKSALGVLP
jgi:Flp pilus assembly protein TadB